MVTDFRHFAPKKVGAGRIARPLALYCRDNRPRPTMCPHYAIPPPPPYHSYAPTMSFLCPHHVIPSVAEESRRSPNSQSQDKNRGGRCRPPLVVQTC